MKKLMSLVVFAALITGISVAEGAAQPIEGSWGMQQTANEFSFDLTLTVQNNTVTLKNVCNFRGQSLTAQVSSPAEYDARTITTFANAHDERSANGMTCDISIKPDRMNYEVSDDSLILSHEGTSDKMVLKRK